MNFTPRRKSDGDKESEKFLIEVHSHSINVSKSPAVIEISSQEMKHNSPIIGSPPLSVGSSSGPICKICHEGDQKEVLISPCNCSGSLAKVHKTCVEKWLSVNADDISCEICSFVFTVRKSSKSFREYIMEKSDTPERISLVNDALCFFLLTPLILIALAMCITGAVQLQAKAYSEDLQEAEYINKVNSGLGVFNDSTTSIDKRFPLGVAPVSFVPGFEAGGLIMLSAVIITLYLTWLVMSLKYQREVYQVWKKTHHHVTLTVTDELSEIA